MYVSKARIAKPQVRQAEIHLDREKYLQWFLHHKVLQLYNLL